MQGPCASDESINFSDTSVTSKMSGELQRCKKWMSKAGSSELSGAGLAGTDPIRVRPSISTTPIRAVD